MIILYIFLLLSKLPFDLSLGGKSKDLPIASNYPLSIPWGDYKGGIVYMSITQYISHYVIFHFCYFYRIIPALRKILLLTLIIFLSSMWMFYKLKLKQ